MLDIYLQDLLILLNSTADWIFRDDGQFVHLIFPIEPISE